MGKTLLNMRHGENAFLTISDVFFKQKALETKKENKLRNNYIDNLLLQMDCKLFSFYYGECDYRSE